jgi:hypothetical protein
MALASAGAICITEHEPRGIGLISREWNPAVQERHDL